MRHKVAGRRLSRTSEHRLAMRRNIVLALFENETISTTIEKAKEVKPFAEKMITLAKKGTLSARRRAIAMLGNRNIVAEEDDRLVKKGTVIGKLFSEIGPRYLDRQGGYTRIVRLSLRRLGDNGKLVLLQLVGENEKTEKKKTKADKENVPQQQVQQEVVEEATEQQQPETEETVDVKGTDKTQEQASKSESQ